MKTKKLLLKGLVLFGATVALAACGSSSTTSSSNSSSTATATWQDGTYTAESGVDDYGYKIVHSITIKDGKITESTFDYADKDGGLKSENAEYNTSMKEKAGVSAKEAIDQLNAELVKTQALSDVDVVTGATHTSEDFKKSTEALLAAAEKGDTALITLK